MPHRLKEGDLEKNTELLLAYLGKMEKEEKTERRIATMRLVIRLIVESILVATVIKVWFF